MGLIGGMEPPPRIGGLGTLSGFGVALLPTQLYLSFEAVKTSPLYEPSDRFTTVIVTFAVGGLYPTIRA